MFDTILVPVDDNPASDSAVKVAAELARMVGAALRLLHIIEPPPTFTADIARRLPPGEFDRSLEEHARSIIHEAETLVPEGVIFESLFRRAAKRTWREILDAADELDADLIVMGTHGREGVARAVLGSVAERVAHHAQVPVMLVR